MKKFLVRLTTFIAIVAGLCILGLFLPATPRAKQNLLFAESQKDSLLIHTPSPRVIFVGGSNLSFGLNSRAIRDTFHVNPVNTAMHAGLGLQYMLKHTLQYVKADDIVILISEYSPFVKDYNDVNEELLRIVAEVNKANFKLLTVKQIFRLMRYVPQYCLSKFIPAEYLNVKIALNQLCYQNTAFNEFGDVREDLLSPGQAILPFAIPDRKFNPRIIDAIIDFERELTQRGAKLYVGYPGLEEQSFRNWREVIDEVQKSFEQHFRTLGTPQRYMMPDSLMFNTAYHLNRQGVEHRTRLLIEDLRQAAIW